MPETLGSLWEFLVRHVYLVAFLVSAIDATGFPFPGRVLLIATGALVAAGDARVVPVILSASAGAVLGDHLWWLLGLWRGRAIVNVGCRIAVRSADCVDRATGLLQRYGAFAIALGRLLAAVRIFVIAVAAGTGMPYYKFISSTIAGATMWSAALVLIGYATGGSGPTGLLIGVLGGGVLIFVGTVAYRMLKRVRHTASSS